MHACPNQPTYQHRLRASTNEVRPVKGVICTTHTATRSLNPSLGGLVMEMSIPLDSPGSHGKTLLHVGSHSGTNVSGVAEFSLERVRSEE